MKQSYRDYFLFFLGINSGLRVSDLLQLRVCDIAHQEHIVINEKKTGKIKKFKINPTVGFEVTRYVMNMNRTDYLFTSNRAPTADKPITRDTAYKALNRVALRMGLDDIGTHTMRKTG